MLIILLALAFLTIPTIILALSTAPALRGDKLSVYKLKACAETFCYTVAATVVEKSLLGNISSMRNIKLNILDKKFKLKKQILSQDGFMDENTNKLFLKGITNKPFREAVFDLNTNKLTEF